MPAAPADYLFHRDSAVLWRFKREASAALAGREIRTPQGSIVGGSKSLNGLVYSRGQAEDFGDWAERGNDGCRYANVLPYSMRTERRIGAADDRFR